MKFYEDRPIGYIVGETSPYKAVFLSTRPPRIGEYVIVEHDEGPMLAMVEDSRAGNPYLPQDITRIETVERINNIMPNDTVYLRGTARILTRIEDLLERGSISPPKTPPKTGYRVYKAPEDVLRKIFAYGAKGDEEYIVRKIGGREEAYIRIGVLADHPKVPVFINIEPFVSLHSAILAVTGQGKSNTVSVIADRMVRHLHATVLIFDMHNEYEGIGGEYSNIIQPAINPVELTLQEMIQLMRITGRATNQQRVLRHIYYEAKNAAKEIPLARKNFLDYMISMLKTVVGEEPDIPIEPEIERKLDEKFKGSKDKDPIYGVLNKLEDVKDLYANILSPDAPVDLKTAVKPGYLNILNLGEVDERGSDVIISYYARRLLSLRKQHVYRGTGGYPTPVLMVIEEAHIIVPREEEKLAKTWIARIAREGRKFGLGICLVSQRPKNIDENALSQTNNKIILKVVEPEDQKYIQKASEQLSDELLEMLTSLRQGEAILLGSFTPIPALVKIDKHPRKSGGRNLNLTRLWREAWENMELEGNPEEFFDMLRG